MSDEKKKPVLDERSFDKLLEAAFVLQEHNRGLRQLELHLEKKRDQLEAKDRAAAVAANDPSKTSALTAHPTDYTVTLGKIVETQHQIHIRQLALGDAISLVADRVIEISGACGAAVGIIDGDSIRYQAVSGQKIPALGTTIPREQALCFPCMETGQVLRSADADLDIALDSAECRHRGIQSLIAAPVFHEGGVAGGLELYYATPHAFTDQDVHTCQLMAGLVTEALVRDEELTLKKSLASERAAMVDVLEKLEPKLAALVEKSGRGGESQAAPPPAGEVPSCWKCGHQLLTEEQFCGECGSPRSTDHATSNTQSKVASLWHMQEAQKKENSPAAEESALKPEQQPAAVHVAGLSTPLVEHTMSEASGASNLSAKAAVSRPAVELLHVEEAESEELTTPEEDRAADAMVTRKLTHPADWSSAAAARDFLEQLASNKTSGSLLQFWNTHRGDVYLAIAVVLVVCVIRWGIWSSRPANASGGPQNSVTAAHRKAPNAELSLFDRMLIQLGLAEAPEATEDRGNPAIQVWVDQRTGLYYCPGSDLYGKTPKGKYVSQRDAQLDQFEPAYRKTCN